VWTYGTGLELNSPRFTQPGDFFAYVVFVMLFILVSTLFRLPRITLAAVAFPLFSSVSSITHLEYLPAQSLLAEAVPEERKITPAAHAFTSFANLSKCLCAV
jgi:hypothetical protein